MRPTLHRSLLLLALSLLSASALAAQEGGCTARHPRVERLRFEGNGSVKDRELANLTYTEKAGRLRRWFGWRIGNSACLDSGEVSRDTRRLAAWYAQRGYPGTTAKAEIAHSSARIAHVTFVIAETAPILIDSVFVTGLPSELGKGETIAHLLVGRPLDDSLVTATTDSVQALLRAAGYARVRPAERRASIDTERRRAALELEFDPGAPVIVGAIDLELTANDSTDPALDSTTILGLLRFDPGDRYSSRKVGDSQAFLYGLDLYRTVSIDTIPIDGTDSVRVKVRIIEGKHHHLRSGGGWGTLDCFRGQTRFTHQNFLNRGHRLQAEARLSKIGIGEPLDDASSLCAPRVREDPFSAKLNYYAGATVQLRGLLGREWQPEIRLFSERRTEFQSYLREVNLGAQASVIRSLDERMSGAATYRFESGRTYSDQAVACGVFGLCRYLDRVLLLVPANTHSAGLSLVRPSLPFGVPLGRDHRWSVESRAGVVNLSEGFESVRYGRAQLEYAIYQPINDRLLFAARAQGGAIVTRDDQQLLIPPQERFYSGGQNSVRGFGQNQLGPKVYIVGAISDTVTVNGYLVGSADPEEGYDRIAPAGGTASALINLELRTRRGWPSDLLRWVAFVDAGRVWNNAGTYSVSRLRITPGLGMRLITPLGPFRVDVGYNPHFNEPGPAFFLQPGDIRTGATGRAICVSPGSLEPLDVLQASLLGATSCPTTFQPPRRRGLLPRLTFHFSIGEAF